MMHVRRGIKSITDREGLESIAEHDNNHYHVLLSIVDDCKDWDTYSGN